MRNIFRIVPLLTTLLSLAACEGAKEQLGLARSAPDEFAVVKRAPLEMPPDYELRPPQPGAPRPQEGNVSEEAQAAVFGEEGPALGEVRAAPAKGGEAALLMNAGATNASPAIRQQVDAETAKLEPKEKPVAEKLLGWSMGDNNEEAAADVVDAKAEAERLKKNAEEGKPVTEGETPSHED